MQRRHETIDSPALGRAVDVLAYGHFGAPIIIFPSGGGRYFDFEGNEMIASLAPLIDAGKIKLYCTDGIDNESWLNDDLDLHQRALRHRAFQDFIVNNLAPAIRADCNDDAIQIGLVGCSLGGLHAANFALKFPDLFHYALCMSGRYDLDIICGGASDSAEFYYNNPLAYTYNLHGDALYRIRAHTHITLVCGQGAWEEKCLAETHRLADALAAKGIPHERDIWGHDVEHHWYWWRKQIVHHLEKMFL